MEEQMVPVTPRKNLAERKAAKKKKLYDIYMTLGIGALTWLVIGVAVFFSARGVIHAVKTVNEPPPLTDGENKPIVPLDNVVIVPAPGTTTNPDGSATTEPEPEPEQEPPVDFEELDYTKLQEGDFLYTGAVATMLMLDFPGFTNVDLVPQEYVVAFGIMETIKNPIYAAGMSVSDLRVYVTSESVELASVSQLKYKQPFNHQSITIGGEFKYDILSKRYSALSHGLDEGIVGRVAQVTNNNQVMDLVIEAYSYADLGEDGQVSATPTKKSKVVVDCTGTTPVIVSVTAME